MQKRLGKQCPSIRFARIKSQGGGNALSFEVDLKPVAINFTLKDHIYEVLRDSILQIDIYDTEQELRLDERKLAEQLGISRTPIREALARLAQDGLVEIIPRKGVFHPSQIAPGNSRHDHHLGSG